MRSAGNVGLHDARRAKDGRSVLVCTVGKTVLLYDARCVADLHAMLKAAGDWVALGAPRTSWRGRQAPSRLTR
ncbi:MAG: DUF6855 family protein [Caldimonas sp.]